LVIVAISLILLTESGPETRDSFVYQRCLRFYNRSC